MPKAEEARRGGVVRYRTIQVESRDGKKRYIHVAVVRKRGKRGGRTVAGPARAYKKG